MEHLSGYEPVKRHKVIFDEHPGSFDGNPKPRSSIGTSPKRMEYHPRNSNAKRCSVFLRGPRVTRKWNRTSRLVFLTPSRKTRWKTTDTFSVAWTPVQMGSITPHRLQIPSLLSTESIQIVYMNTFFVVSLHSFHPSQRNGAHHPRLWTVVLSFCRQMPRHRQSFCFFVSERVLHTWFTDNSTNAQTICIDWSWFGYLLHALAEKLTICEPWWIGANFGVAEIFRLCSVPKDVPNNLFALLPPSVRWNIWDCQWLSSSSNPSGHCRPFFVVVSILYRDKFTFFVVSVYLLFSFFSSEELALCRWDQHHRVPHLFESAVKYLWRLQFVPLVCRCRLPHTIVDVVCHPSSSSRIFLVLSIDELFFILAWDRNIVWDCRAIDGNSWLKKSNDTSGIRIYVLLYLIGLTSVWAETYRNKFCRLRAF